MEPFNIKLQELRERLAVRKKKQGRLRTALLALKGKQAELGKLKIQLAKERKDVDKLEGLSLTALFHTVLSSKVEQLAIERQQFLRAQLKWGQCLSAVSKLKVEVAELTGVLEVGVGLEAELEGVLREKEQVLLRSTDGKSKALLDLVEKIADARIGQAELGEAWAAGDEASESLEKVIKSLQSAKGWGVYDMVGGGIFATAVKHSHIGKAKTAMDDAVYELETFQEELKDVQVDWEISLEISSFNSFSDYLLDGLIFDWVVQSKINKSLKACQDAKASVTSILRRLDREITAIKATVSDLQIERQELIAAL
jgi:hypothetical protein